ncbi:MAG: AEC family transporter, partial [Alphaproteobacteria bacterium]
DIGAAAAAPTALFALGATLAGFRIAGDLAEAATVGGLKLVLNPLIAWALAGPVLGLAPMTVAAVTMLAALPCAVNPFLLASRYEAYTRRASAAIVLSTAASVVTVAIATTLAS